MNQHIIRTRLLALFVMLSVITSCAQVTATSQPSVAIPSPTSIPPTKTLTVTQTSVPTLTSSSTSIPSRPIPTPIAKENTEITLELLRTNNNCDLPCWWGIIPNQTSWSDAEKFLNSFSTIYERQPPSEWFVYDVHSPLPIEFSDVYAVRVVFAVQKGLVKEIEIGYFDEEIYHLSTFLLKYGIPDQIFVSTYSSDYGLPPNQVPLSINLHYPEKGINALYGTYAIVYEERISGCISDSPIIFLWSPNEHSRSIDYILGWDKNNTPYLEIEQANGMSIEEFYEKYSVLENETCIETTTSLWPAQ